jgi:hypothetical protein
MESDTLERIEAMLGDLVWLNAVIATELIQITENSSSILRKEAPPETCREDHNAIRAEALRIVGQYSQDATLSRHLNRHQ